MPIMRIVLIDVILSLAIAGMGTLLVVLSLGAVERWRTALLTGHRGRHNPPMIAADIAPYAAEKNVRMMAESLSSVLRHEHSIISPTYRAVRLVRARVNHKKRFGSGARRIQARSVKGFRTEPNNEKGAVRGRRLRDPLHEYSGQI